MAKIAFKAVTKQYPGASKPAVDAISFDVPEGATCMLLGTSGSGKTTLLRMVNRLIEPTSGEIVVDGKDILQEDPITLRRSIGYVIQQVGLFPHMNIAQNIRVTTQIAGWSRQRMAERVDELLSLVGLEPSEYRSRFPIQLSGGQQQRVGLARALATDPALLLMDEPFGALDAITRARMQDELLRIQDGVRKTILFVTHDVEEAFKLGDQIAILSEGKLVQLGTPVELLTKPANEFVSKLVGAESILRQLQYVPVLDALEGQPDVVSSAHWGDALEGRPDVVSSAHWRDALEGRPDAVSSAHWDDAPTCFSDSSLLDALLKLLETNAPFLAVQDKSTQQYLGTITLASINREITSARNLQDSRNREETKI